MCVEIASQELKSLTPNTHKNNLICLLDLTLPDLYNRIVDTGGIVREASLNRLVDSSPKRTYVHVHTYAIDGRHTVVSSHPLW